MKRLIDFLENMGLEKDSQSGNGYKAVKLGNSTYFNDGFSVDAITVYFSYDLTASEGYKNLDRQIKELKDYVSKHKTLSFVSSGKCGIFEPWFTISTVFDRRRLIEHENRVKEAVEAFWIAEHERRNKALLESAM